MSKNGLHLITPTSIASTGTGNSSSISANGSVTFDNCATLSLNGVFSADYDNYMIVCRNEVNGSSYDDIRLRFRASGTDDSTASSYVYEYFYASSTTVGAGRTTTNSFYLALFGTEPAGFVAHVYAPYLAQPTAVRSVSLYSISAAPSDIWDVVGTHNQSTAYDGFSIYPTNTSRPAKGLIAVYGMRK